MKTRRVFVTLEVETSAPLSTLRSVHSWRWGQSWCGWTLDCLQAQANVAQAPKKKRARKKA